MPSPDAEKWRELAKAPHNQWRVCLATQVALDTAADAYDELERERNDWRDRFQTYDGDNAKLKSENRALRELLTAARGNYQKIYDLSHDTPDGYFYGQIAERMIAAIDDALKKK